MSIKGIRTKNGLSQPDVAAALGLSTVVYSRYENGSRQTPIDVLIQIADLFGVTLDYLLDRKSSEDITISDFENGLLIASRNADERARQDALNILLSHSMPVTNSEDKAPDTNPENK
ncbi:MAG: helix-turn-helix transcriptional regulator [Paludibacteraceae bacterium]|nr:helix-turn-helix transcriptional regulator [Paludibacteraceae bacterium]